MHARSVSFILLLLGLTTSALAHMQMTSPPPRGNVAPPVGTVDYNLKNPLNGRDRPFPCGGKPRGSSMATVKAGTQLPVSLGGSAIHDGGHCQFALSVDGVAWVVVKDVIRNCLLNNALTYNVPIPASFPSGPVILAWAWINAIGNREYYMSCADITIQGGGAGFTGPQLLVVNLPGVPTVPEMLPGIDDGRSLFLARPMITIGTKQGAPAVQVPTVPHPKPAPVPTQVGLPKPAPTTVPVIPALPPVPQPAPASPPATTCAGGVNAPAMFCSGTGFILCVDGKPTPVMPCAPSTSCRPFGKYILCLPPNWQ
ncbi:hypothetical protein DFJ77DRAFT_445208 [Powellomyces hirtus]|nr:hypothetical protein DFJ77DRAFT_445208 [Powellomyces hirtus]